jgi:hypothetical protein
VFRTTLALFLIAAVALASNPTAGHGKGTAFPVHPTLHTNPVTNNTGQTANDLHVNVGNVFNPQGLPPTTNPALTFIGPFGGGNQTLLSFNGSDVANKSTVEVTWGSTLANDAITGGNWTKDGNNIGDIAAGIIKAEVMPDPTGAPNKGVIFINNTSGKPVDYTNLAVFDFIPGFGFTPDLYLTLPSQLGTPPVAIDLPSAGTLAPGLTELAEIDTSGAIGPVSGIRRVGLGGLQSLAGDPPPFYDVGFLDINGQRYGLGASSEVITPAVVPEPGSLTTLAIGLLCLAGAAFRVSFRRRQAAGAAGA